MSQAAGRHTILSELDTYYSEEEVRAIIETPKGSRNKYRYDPGCNGFELATALPQGMTFPFNFGFLPSTLGEDGDPLDLLVLMDAPVPCGCMLRCRVIGVIEARQQDADKRWERNDRLVAVASHARTHDGIEKLSQLRPHLLQDIKAFFEDYNKLDGKKFAPLGDHGPHRALKLIRKGVSAYSKQQGRSSRID